MKTSDSPRKELPGRVQLPGCPPLAPPPGEVLCFVLCAVRIQGPGDGHCALADVHFQGQGVCFLHPLAARLPAHNPSQSAASLPGDGFYLAVGGAVAQHNWSHITTVLQDQRFRCQLIDSSEDLGMISIQGPAR